MKINYCVEIDMEDVFSEMSQRDRELFIASHLDELGDLTNIAETWYTQEDINLLMQEHAEDIPDEVIISQAIERNLELG